MRRVRACTCWWWWWWWRGQSTEYAGFRPKPKIGREQVTTRGANPRNMLHLTSPATFMFDRQTDMLSSTSDWTCFVRVIMPNNKPDTSHCSVVQPLKSGVLAHRGSKLTVTIPNMADLQIFLSSDLVSSKSCDCMYVAFTAWTFSGHHSLDQALSLRNRFYFFTFCCHTFPFPRYRGTRGSPDAGKRHVTNTSSRSMPILIRMPLQWW